MDPASVCYATTRSTRLKSGKHTSDIRISIYYFLSIFLRHSLLRNIVTVCNKRTGWESNLCLVDCLPAWHPKGSPPAAAPLAPPAHLLIRPPLLFYDHKKKANAPNWCLDKFIQHISCDQHINIIILYAKKTRIFLSLDIYILYIQK